MLSALSLDRKPDSLPNINPKVKPPLLTINQVLKNLRIVPARQPSDSRDSSVQGAVPTASAIIPVFREHAKHAAGLNENHDSENARHKERKPDRAWFFPHGQEKYAHLLRDPVCICGVNVDENSIKCQDGEICLILDTHRAISEHRWRSGDQVARLVPEELEQCVKFGVPPARLLQDEHKVAVANHASHKIQLPRLHPTGAHQMRHVVKMVDQVVEAWQPDPKSGSGDFSAVVASQSPMMKLVTAVYDEQCLYNAVFFEAIRQCTVHCAERGQFLADIRKCYTGLLHSTINFLKGVHHELLVQRSLNRRLAEHFIGYKSWWDVMEFRFDTIKQNSITGRTTEAKYKNLPDNSRLAFLIDDDSQLFKGYTKLFEIQRAALKLDQDDMLFERELWQDLAHLLATQLMENPNYAEFRQLHNVQRAWAEAAKQVYQRVVVQDQKQVLGLREQTKVWLGTLSHLEKRLADNERAVFDTLTSTREDIETTVHRFLDREGPVDEELMLDVTDRLRKWITRLNHVLSQFQATQAQQNLQFSEKAMVTFEALVVNTIVALVGRHARERSFATGPIPPTDEAQSTRVLQSMEQRYTLIKAPQTEVDPVTGKQRQTSQSVDQLTITGSQFDNTVEVFTDLLRRYRAYEADLTLLHGSQPFAELYSLWQRYHAIQPSLHDRIFGDSGLPVALADLEENMEQILNMALNPRCNYFSELDPGRFASAAFGFVHTIDVILTNMKTNFNISPLFAEPKNNLIRDLIQNARTWFLFCESNLAAMTQGILDKIADFSEQMLRIGINLMVTVLPDQDFEEERYMQLYKKRADLTIGNKLDLTELQIEALTRELDNFSRALDEQAVSLANSDPRDTQEALPETLSKVAEWRVLGGNLLHIAYQINDIEKASLEGTALSRYRQKLNTAKTAIAQHQFSPAELMDLVDTNMDKHDFVEITNLGDEVNIYVKPFCIATAENVDRETDLWTTGYTEHMLAELAVQRDLNAVTQQRIRDLEDGLIRAKSANQILSETVTVLRNEQSVPLPVLPKYTDEPMEVIELTSLIEAPEIMKPGRLPDVLQQQTISTWDALLQSVGPDSILAKTEPRKEYDFSAKMSEMQVFLRPHHLRLTARKQAIEPLLEPDLDGQEYFRQRKADRDQARVERRLQCEKIREERYKAQNA